MNYLNHILHSKGMSHALARALMIYRRFGFTRKKSREALQRIHEITAEHGCTPSFFITAELLDHHWDLIQNISDNGTHLGLHGCHHIDYTGMSGAGQSTDIARGLEKFKKRSLPVSGFRAPFLRSNEETAKAAAENGFTWISHSTMVFDDNVYLNGLDKSDGVRHLVEAFYTARSNVNEPSLPSWGLHCLEIPVSLPDDELLVDRLGIRDSQKLTNIWLDMLGSSHRQGEFFNFIFHPERIDSVAQPLNALLQKAASHGDVWVTSLDDISRWWHERKLFSFEIAENQHNIYKVAVHCNDRASIALQHPGGKLEFLTPDANGTVTVRSDLKPVIAVSEGLSEQELRYWVNEGFFVDQNEDPSQCAFIFDYSRHGNDRQLSQTLRQARGPLLRFWRWPNRYKSALAITADIDAITIWDFIRRARHFRKVSSR